MADEKDKIEVDEEFVKAVGDSIMPAISETIKDAIASATEKTIKKDVADEAAAAEADKVTEPVATVEEETKEFRFMKACLALRNGDMSVVRAYNAKAMEMRAKAGYGNVGVDADGGYLVPDPDFDAEVERLEEEYGVAFQYADVRTINGNAVKLNKKIAGFNFVETTESGEIAGVKMSIGQVTADLREFAAIASATNILDADSAIDYWAEVTTEFARARAQLADELVFTDATGDGSNANTKGIMEMAGTAAQTIGSALTDLDWDDLMDAEVKVPTPSAKNARWFIHRTTWNKAVQKKDGESRYLFQPNPNGLTTPWGTPVTLCEVLPSSVNVGSNTAFAVFGDLKRDRLYVKRGLELTILTEGIVKDADGNNYNLALQNGKALRGVTRMLNVVKFPEAFCILGTGTVS
jgi:HK97 family phage major capsid protein